MIQQVQIDGIDVMIEGTGEETIVMIHGWPDTYRLWDAQVAALQDQYRCVRFTLPGFDLGKPRRAYSLAETIGIFKNIIEQVSPGKKVILMLHDWGCIFGYQFYMRHQSMVSRMMGVDIGDAESKQFVSSLSVKAKLMVLVYQTWLAFAWRIGGAFGDRMSRFMARALKCRSDQQFIHSGMNYPYYITWTGTYGSYKNPVPFAVACPFLFIYGTKKPFMFHSPQWLDALQRRNGCRAVAIATNHWVMLGAPQEFNHVVQTWLEDTKTLVAPVDLRVGT